MDCERDISAIRNKGADIPLTVKGMGHYVLSVVASSTGPLCFDRVPNLAASYFEWTFLTQCLGLSNGGLRLRFTDDGLLRFVPPKDFPACAAAALGDARDESVSGHRKISMNSHVNWGHASAYRLERVLVD